jgi:hypothetical protein
MRWWAALKLCAGFPTQRLRVPTAAASRCDYTDTPFASLQKTCVYSFLGAGASVV